MKSALCSDWQIANDQYIVAIPDFAHCLYILCQKKMARDDGPSHIERWSEVTEEEIDSIRCTIDVAIIICQEILFYITNKIPFQAFSLDGLRYVLLGGFLREKNEILNNLGSTNLK